ncbi:5-methylcytosine restriction system specificity protein McrC, partial [Escherichia coli]
FVISVCKFIVNNSIPGQNKGHYRFYDFERNEKEMSLLYQKFLYEFCRRELTSANTTRSYLKWDASSISDQSLNLLPRMETDITIRSSEKILIVDAKYYKSIFSRRMGTEKFHSQNLYQLMNYLWSLKPENGENIGGLLIYPHVDTAV